MEQFKRKIIFLAIGIITLFVTMGFYVYQVYNNGGFEIYTLLPFLIVILITIFLGYVVFLKYKDVKTGEPLEDEMTKQLLNKAASKSFFLSLYWILGLSMFFSQILSDIFFDGEELDSGMFGGIAIIGMGIIFFVTWIYYKQKGDV